MRSRPPSTAVATSRAFAVVAVVAVFAVVGIGADVARGVVAHAEAVTASAIARAIPRSPSHRSLEFRRTLSPSSLPHSRFADSWTGRSAVASLFTTDRPQPSPGELRPLHRPRRQHLDRSLSRPGHLRAG